MKQTVDAAKQAQQAWALIPVADRIKIIGRACDVLQDNIERLAKQLSDEMGKPLSQSVAEIKGLKTRIHFFCEHVESIFQTERVSPQGEATVEEITREPLGVITHISAWNYPYFVGGNVIFPALLTGNAVIYKPSEFAALTGVAFANCLYEAGVPKEILPVVTGAGDVAQKILAQDIDGMFFTGSYATGVKISQTLAGRMIHTQYELGGKDPTYVCDDVDVDAAAESLAEGFLYNTGQGCCSVERIYVHHTIYEQFLNKLVEYAKKIEIGRLTRPAQKAVLEHQIADAKQKGGRALLEGERTVIADAHHNMAIMRDESFGPVIGVQCVSGDEEALQLMNDTSYGLTAGVYTRSETRARRLLERVNAGSVYWNCCDRVSPRLPWSGRRHSGLGVTLSIEGIKTFTRPKAWHLRDTL